MESGQRLPVVWRQAPQPSFPAGAGDPVLWGGEATGPRLHVGKGEGPVSCAPHSSSGGTAACGLSQGPQAMVSALSVRVRGTGQEAGEPGGLAGRGGRTLEGRSGALTAAGTAVRGADCTPCRHHL